MGSALAMLGIALALVPLGLSAVGYELNHKQGYAILILTGLFVAGALIVFFWPWLVAAWAWLRRDAELRKARESQERLNTKLHELEQERAELEAENEELIARGQPDKLVDTLEEWLKTTPLRLSRIRPIEMTESSWMGSFTNAAHSRIAPSSLKGRNPSGFRLIRPSRVWLISMREGRSCRHC